jgi:signal transduction histidine kinase
LSQAYGLGDETVGLIASSKPHTQKVFRQERSMVSPLVLRLTAPLVAVSLLLLGVGVGAAWYVQHMQRSVSQRLGDNVSRMRAAEEVEILIHGMRAQFYVFLLTGEESSLELSPAFRKDTDFWLGVAERCSASDSDRDLTGRARRGYETFLRDAGQLSASMPSAQRKSRVISLIDEVMVREILQPIHSYLDNTAEIEVEKSVAETQQLADRLFYGLLWLGICGCGAGLVAGFGLARGISRSLIQLSVPIRAAAGQLETVVGPITFAAGTDLGHLEGMMRSIAERIGAVVERLRQSEREVLRSEQLAAVGQMAAGMAHELRNPLTSMKLLVQGAMEQESLNPPDDETDDYRGRGLGGRDLRILEEEISRLEGLVQSFVQFARPPKVERREVDLRRLTEQAVHLVTARAAQRGIRLECRLPDEPLRFPVDSSQLSQVLLNLLLNAVDAVPSGGLVRVELAREADGRLRLEVSDNGCGLPPELGSRIFAPFVTTKETGLGLGLSITKRIVEAHGGSIVAANRAESGAVFTVHLPPPESASGEPAALAAGYEAAPGS